MIAPDLRHPRCRRPRRSPTGYAKAARPTLVFLPGYASDMEGTKALALDAFAERRGPALLRFDYSGTGSSGGQFEDGTLALWLEEALAAIDRLTEGPLIVVGSSMGGWIALHLALLRPGTSRRAGRDRRRARFHRLGLLADRRDGRAPTAGARLLGIGAAASAARQGNRDRLPGPPDPRRGRRRSPARCRVSARCARSVQPMSS